MTITLRCCHSSH